MVQGIQLLSEMDSLNPFFLSSWGLLLGSLKAKYNEELAIIGVHRDISWCMQQAEQSVQKSSVTHSGPTLCDPMNYSTPGLPVHHQPLEFTQTHVYRVRDAI